jgi:hypothetical protein
MRELHLVCMYVKMGMDHGGFGVSMGLVLGLGLIRRWR